MKEGKYLPAKVIDTYIQFGHDWIVHNAVNSQGTGLLKTQYSMSDFRTGAAIPMAPQSTVNRAIDRGISVLRAAGITQVNRVLEPLRTINPPGKKVGGFWKGYHSGVRVNPRKNSRKNPSFDYRQAYQALGGVNRLQAMVGIKYPTYGKNFIQFKFSGSQKANTLKMILNDRDLYDMEFYKIRGTNFKKVKEFNNVYASDVKNVFSDYTGLYLNI